MGSMEASAQQWWRGGGGRGDNPGHRTTRARGVSGGDSSSAAGSGNGWKRESWRTERQSGKEVKRIIAELTPVLRGWGNYFRTGNADREFNKMDYFVVQSLRRWQYRRGGQRPTKRPPFTGHQLYGMGLHKLMGTVKCPAQATPRRSSLSRVCRKTARTV